MLTSGDRRWQDLGRAHFLNREAFERRGHAQPTGLLHLPVLPTLSVAPLLDLLVALTLLVLPFWAIWRVTEWVSPGSARVLRWAGRRIYRNVRQVVRGVCRWALRTVWHRPVEQLGAGVTIWLWLVAAVGFGTIGALVTGRFVALAALLPLAVLAIGWWRLVRWWRRRIYRARPLPARRRRPDHG